jgi:protein-S-isoprenylcysteine O-methyltransferase Ste14
MDLPLAILIVAFIVLYLLEWPRRVRERLRRDGAADRHPRSRRLLRLTQLPAVVLALVAGVLLPSLALPGDRFGFRIGGLALMCLGAALRWWAIVTLGRLFRGSITIQRDHHIVSTGPYRWLRHPSYTGGWIVMLGFGLGTGNALSFLLCLGLPLIGIVHRIEAEEAELASALPGEYPDYAARTSRMIPFLW